MIKLLSLHVRLHPCQCPPESPARQCPSCALHLLGEGKLQTPEMADFIEPLDQHF